MYNLFPNKVDRKTYIITWLIITIIGSIIYYVLLENYKTAQTSISILLFFLHAWFMNARFNDIGYSIKQKLWYVFLLFIPLAGLYTCYVLIFKKSDSVNKISNEPQYSESINDTNKNFTLEKDWKKIWILIFCLISLLLCTFYVPYNAIKPDKNIIVKSDYSTLFTPPKGFNPKVTHIDYQSMMFRELLILIGCGAGYILTTMIKKD